jgi:general secretion pathway protein C
VEWLKQNFWIANLVTIALCSLFLARATTHALSASFLLEEGQQKAAAGARRRAVTAAIGPAVPSMPKTTDDILRRNMFCSTCPPILDKPASASSPESAGVQKCTRPLLLVSTLTSDDPIWSFAAIRDTSTKETGLFGVGSPILGGTVDSIEETRVYLRFQAGLEYLDLVERGAAPTTAASTAPAAGPNPDDALAADLDKGVRKISETQYELNRDLVNKVLADTNALARAARIVPSVVDGKPNGFKLYAIRPNSVYARIGLQNGDTVRAINGFEMTSPDKALEVYTKLRSASHLSVSINRRGQDTTLDYNVR